MLEDLLPRLAGFDLIDAVERHPRLVLVRVPRAQVLSLLARLKQGLGFVTLQTIGCADWIEDGVFRLTYLLETATRDRALGVQTDLGREGEAIETAIPLWPQAEIFERELHEMFGIPVIGHPSLGDFMLEGWSHTPPLRREFDTLRFVQEQFERRPGREDNQDVREAIRRRKETKRQADGDPRRPKSVAGDAHADRDTPAPEPGGAS